jgi:aminoglycoside 3-N-acetyltransferase
MSVTYHDLVFSLRQLNLDRFCPVIVHASLSSFGEVKGGAETLLGALLTQFNSILMPTFTYSTMIIPLVGPENNGVQYGINQDSNKMAEFYYPGMPADSLMGVVAETLRVHPSARRSIHPILSFSGIGMIEAIKAQTLTDPFAPIRILAEESGWVLLLGVDHTVNTSIHYAEKIAGRKQFVRWALTPQGIRECPGFPGCSDGFQAIMPYLESVTRKVQVGNALIQAVAISELVAIVQDILAINAQALLCNRKICERCDAVRKSISQ